MNNGIRRYTIFISKASIFLTRAAKRIRSEEHTSELQSHSDLVCRLLLEKKTRARRENPIHPRRRWRKFPVGCAASGVAGGETPPLRRIHPPPPRECRLLQREADPGAWPDITHTTALPRPNLESIHPSCRIRPARCLARIPGLSRHWLGNLLSAFFFYSYGHPRDLHSFPTRRSSD